MADLGFGPGGGGEVPEPMIILEEKSRQASRGN